MAHILVLEDDKNLCTLLGESLEDEGYRVTLCSDPESAIKQARTTSYDLMITDVRMAGVVDGVGALQAIKRIRPRIRSIVMTGYADSAVPARAANIQADEYLLKGDKNFGLDSLLTNVQKVLERQDPSWWNTLFQGWTKPKGPTILPELEDAKRASRQAYFILIRSGHISPELAMAYWNCFSELDQMPPEMETVQRYQDLMNEPPWQAKSSPIDETALKQLFKRVRQGTIDNLDFSYAQISWGRPQDFKSTLEDFARYQRLWGKDSGGGELANLKDRIIQGHTLTYCICHNQEVAVYRTVKDGKPNHIIVAHQSSGTFEDAWPWNEFLCKWVGKVASLKNRLLRLPPKLLWQKFRPIVEARSKSADLDPYIWENTLAVVEDMNLIYELDFKDRKELCDRLLSESRSPIRNMETVLYSSTAAGLKVETVNVINIGHLLCRQLTQRTDKYWRRLLGELTQDYKGCWHAGCATVINKAHSEDENYTSLAELIQDWDLAVETDITTTLSDAYSADNALSSQQALDWWLPAAWLVEQSHRQGKVYGNLCPQAFHFSNENYWIEFPPGLANTNFVSPEVLSGQSATVQSDVYSLALMLACLLAPKPERRTMLEPNFIYSGRHQDLKQALDVDPEKRHPSVEAIMIYFEKRI